MRKTHTDSDFDCIPWLRSRLLRRASRLVGGDYHAAEDLVQEALLRTIQRGLEEPDCPGSWYGRLMRNLAAHRWARASRSHEERGEFSETSGETSEPADILMHRERGVTLVQALGRLPDRYRIPLELRYMEGCDLKEVARCLGLSYYTVRTQIRRGLERLQSMLLAPDLDDESPGPKPL